MINPLVLYSITGLIVFFIACLSCLVLMRKIRERDSFVWYILLLALLFASSYYRLVDAVAYRLGIAYPLSLMFLLGILVLFVIAFYHSYKISQLTNRLTRLSQELALRTQDDSKQGER